MPEPNKAAPAASRAARTFRKGVSQVGTWRQPRKAGGQLASTLYEAQMTTPAKAGASRGAMHRSRAMSWLVMPSMESELRFFEGRMAS